MNEAERLAARLDTSIMYDDMNAAKLLRSLQAENEALQTKCAMQSAVNNGLLSLEKSLRVSNDKLTADANRYRWLRDQNADLDAGFYVGDETDALPEDITWVGSDLDTAIDAAMKGEPHAND